MAEPVYFTDAPEVLEIARGIAADHHPHVLRHRLECIFRSKPLKRLRREVWATANVVRGREAFLATPKEERERIWDRMGEGWPLDFFLIEVALPVWESLEERHGLWEPSMEPFAAAIDVAIQRDVDKAVARELGDG